MRRWHLRMIRYVIAVLPALLAVAQQPEEARPGAVRGQVVSITGAPVRKAEVFLRGASANRQPRIFAATTDSSGAFAFENVAAGPYTISAQRNGFVRQDGVRRAGMPPAFQGITVASGQEVRGVSIKLVPHSVITGRITDEDNEPMFGASVHVMEERYMRGRRSLTPFFSAAINDLGEFRLAGLPPGRYYLAIEPRHDDFGLTPVRVKPPGEEAERSFVTVYYPGVLEQNQAAPITLQPGQEARGMDLQVRRAATVHIRGRVVDEGGNPVINTAVSVSDGDNPTPGMERLAASVRPDGSFDIASVPPGTRVLMARSRTSEGGMSLGIAHVQVGPRDVDGVVLRMAPPAQVTGTIQAAENPALQNVRVLLDPADAFPFDMHSSRSLDAGNSFSIGNVTPGRYRIDVAGAPDGYYLRSATIGGQDVLESGITVAGSMSGLEIILAKGATTIEGSVQDSQGKGVGQSLVALVPPTGKRDQWRLFKTSLANQEGRFILRNLPPGEYTLFAFGPNGDAGVVQNPEQLKQIESQGTAVKLDGNVSESVQLKVVN